MAEQSVVQVLLLAVLAWSVVMYWSLFVRCWPGWQHVRLWKKPRRRKRRPRLYKKPKPFEGLTREPVCVACLAEAEVKESAEKRELPPRIERNRGRRPWVDTSKYFCCEERCEYYGWLGRGNIVSNGHLSGGRWRQLKCVVCGKHFQQTIGTVFYGSSVPAEDIMHGMALLCEGVSPRKVARVYKVDKDTVLSWLMGAAVHSEAVLGYMLHDLHLNEVQMDELYALLSEMRGEEGERGRCWVWAAIDPISKLVLALEVGDRSLEMAQQLVHGVVSVLAPGVVPLFVTDQLAADAKAPLTHFGCWVERTSERSGRVLQRWVPDERLRYAQVRKRPARRKAVEVRTRVVYGTSEAVRGMLKALGQKINTAYIERVSRTLRAHVAGLGRREEGLAKTEPALRQRGMLVIGYYNPCLPHASLREPLPRPIPTKGNGSAKKWQPRTPAMAADLTDHLWSVDEFLLFRVPPWRQERMAA
jgi:IS1 family transposase